jgi:hypothetical protein
MDTLLLTARPVSPAESVGGTSLTRGIDGRLRLETRSGEQAVVVRRCFPWSEPLRYISLRNDEDEELALVEDPEGLEPASREALETAMAEAGFVLEVVRVVRVDEEIEIRHWTVETIQGPRTFQTRLDDWPRSLPGGGTLIRDVGGDLYQIGSPEKLDRHSRKLLWAFVD